MRFIFYFSLFFLLCSLAILQPQHLQAQKHDYNWVLGYNSLGDPGDSTWGGVDLNFNTSPIDVKYNYRPADMLNTNVSISDAQGELLFYSNGCRIYNRKHEVMLNGDSLNPGNSFNLNCDENGDMGLQSMVIIPSENSDSIYNIFHKRNVYRDNADSIDPNGLTFLIQDKLYRTKVNIHKDDGLGKVVEKNKEILDNDSLTNDLVAVKHSNSKDWWLLVTSEILSNTKWRFLLQENGKLKGPYKQNIGNTINRTGNGVAHAVLSPSGLTFAYANAYDGIYLYDFDRSTGEFSNFRKLSIPADSLSDYYSLSFSSNGRFLYATDTRRIWQFDMYKDNIQNSRIEVANMTDIVIDGWPAFFFRMQRGPDCKIYITGSFGVNYLHVIHHPNRKGLACDVEIAGLPLPAKNANSIPHFPNYRLDKEPVCDSSILFVNNHLPNPESDNSVKLYPNPTQDQVQIEPSSGWTGSVIKLFNMRGKLLISRDFTGQISLAQQPEGIYLLQIITENGQTITEQVVKH